MLFGLFVVLASATALEANVDSSEEDEAASSEDFIVTEFSLASSADQARYWAAMDRWHFALFPELPLPSVTMGKYLPMLRLSFQAKGQLFDPKVPGLHSAALYLCSGPDPKWALEGVHVANILWQGRLLDQEASQQIAEQLSDVRGPQEYEIFFTYAYWDPSADREKKDQATLLPIPDDICLQLQQPDEYAAPSSFYAISSTGELFSAVGLLRISKEAVNEAVGGLPRPVAVPAPGDWLSLDE